MKLETTIFIKLILSGIIMGMLVNDAHYDLRVLLHSGSEAEASIAQGHYSVVAGGQSIVFEYFVPMFILGFLITQGYIFYRMKNVLAGFQTILFVTGMIIFSIFVDSSMKNLATGQLQGDQLTSATHIVAIGHLSLIAMLLISVVIDKMNVSIWERMSINV